MNVNATVQATAGNISIAPFTAGRAITLGAKPGGTLGLTALELGQFSATGALSIGDSTSGAMTISGATLLRYRRLEPHERRAHDRERGSDRSRPAVPYRHRYGIKLPR